MANEMHEQRAGGIFIPYDKLLANMDQKLDEIQEELRKIEQTKVDRAVFESFKGTYESKNERLAEKIVLLENDKVSRDAVRAQTRYYLAGGSLLGVIGVFNLIINLVQVKP